jgi:hypothetical protein
VTTGAPTAGDKLDGRLMPNPKFSGTRHGVPRFQAAIAPVATHVVAGPVEPFYLTRLAVVA